MLYLMNFQILKRYIILCYQVYFYILWCLLIKYESPRTYRSLIFNYFETSKPHMCNIKQTHNYLNPFKKKCENHFNSYTFQLSSLQATAFLDVLLSLLTNAVSERYIIFFSSLLQCVVYVSVFGIHCKFSNTRMI